MSSLASKLTIGKIEINPPTVLAPMAGITNYPTRILAKEQGCGLVCAEMVSDKGLLYGNERTKRMLYVNQLERPLSMQLFGSDVESFVRAAIIVDQESDADIIDINMGCPVAKVTKPGGGAALMRDLGRARAIIEAVVKAVKKPVTVKMRKGWDDNQINVIELAKIAEQAGIAAITVHGRTREQMYSGCADWQIIADVVRSVSIPVIGNGDVISGETAIKMRQDTGCAGVMIGRAAQGNPWIFREIAEALTALAEKQEEKQEEKEQQQKRLVNGFQAKNVTARERIATCERHAQLLMQFKPERFAIQEMRKHAAWYIKGQTQAASVRNQIMQAKTTTELIQAMHLILH